MLKLLCVKKIIFIVMVLLCTLSCKKRDVSVLNIFIWSDYIAPELIVEFEKQYNCKIYFEHYISNEMMISQLLHSKKLYDVISPSGDYISILLEHDLLGKIDSSRLSNYTNLDTAILDEANKNYFFDTYAIPYFWGATGILYNKKFLHDVDENDIGWYLFKDPRFEGKRAITLLDDMREVIGAALLANGYSPNDTSESALSKARRTLYEWGKNVSVFVPDITLDDMLQGDILLAQQYNGLANKIAKRMEHLEFVLPMEGTTFWMDFLAIPKNAKNKDLAYLFINFILDENIGLINTLYTHNATPNKAVRSLLPEEIQNNKTIYIPNDYLEKRHFITNVGNEILKFEAIWQEARKY